MINCKIKNATYGSELFCKICGMDIGLDFVLKSSKHKTGLYCCDNCAKKE